MHNWILKMFFSKTVRKLEHLQDELARSVQLVEKEKEFCARNNVTCLNFEDVNSDGYKREISSIWKNNTFQFLLHIVRNGLISELIVGGESASKNVPGMLKGIEALAIDMQKCSQSIERTNHEKV